MNRSTLTFAAALVGLAAPALADDVAGDTTTTATLPARTFVGGAFDFEGDSDWFRVDLKAGRLYAVGTSVPRFGTLKLRLHDAAGAALSYGPGGTLGGPWDGTGGSGGAEFQVPADGAYFVETVDLGETAYPTAYSLLLDDADCPDSRNSPCTIGTGQTIAGTLAWWEDGDWLWFQAQQGRSYALRVDACEPIDLRVYGRFGDLKAVGSPDDAGSSLAWKAPQTKWYVMRVIGTDVAEQGTPYDLSVSQGARIKPRHPVAGCQVAVTKTRR